MPSTLSPTILLSQLLHHRWALPILAELHASDGSKFITLVKRLEVSKDSLSRTLEALIAQGWVMRNPGYGHPLRPEYVLTPQGMVMGEPALRLMKKLADLGITDTALRKWSLPVLFALSEGEKRFSDLLKDFPTITNRALTLTLKDLEGIGLVERVENRYAPSGKGQGVAEMLERLVVALAEI